MLAKHIDKQRNLFLISPGEEITSSDFKQLARSVNDYINETDQIPNFVIHTLGLPNWKNLSAMREHFHFIHDHQNIVKKIAIVGDGAMLSMVPLLADHFVRARLRHFSEAQGEQAEAWAASADDTAGGFEIIEGLADNVVGIRAVGVLTAQAYEETLVPLMEQKLSGHEKVNLLFVADERFDTMTPGAMWDDARFGIMNITRFGRIAVVTDVNWLSHGVHLFGPLMPAEVQVFAVDQEETARQWVTSSD